MMGTIFCGYVLSPAIYEEQNQISEANNVCFETLPMQFVATSHPILSEGYSKYKNGAISDHYFCFGATADYREAADFL